MHISLKGNAKTKLGSLADLDIMVVTGGGAEVLHNQETIYDEFEWDRAASEADKEANNYPTLKHFDDMAETLPGDWLCIMNAPLWSATYQRQGKGNWVCIEVGDGFA